MYILGLTGSIGMGKTEAGKTFRRLGVPVYDADDEVHRLFRRGGAAVAPVGEAFPGVIHDGMIDRAELGTRVFGNAEALAKLESIVHPLLQTGRHDFLCRAARAGRRVVVLDIPLLLETGAEERLRRRRRGDGPLLRAAPTRAEAAGHVRGTVRGNPRASDAGS